MYSILLNKRNYLIKETVRSNALELATFEIYLKLLTTVYPSNNAIRPQHAFERNIGELEISGLTNFQPCTTFGGRENAQKTKRQKTKTLNDRLPLKQRPYEPQTLSKHVSDDPRHFICRPRTFVFSDFVGNFLIFLGFWYYFEELT